MDRWRHRLVGGRVDRWTDEYKVQMVSGWVSRLIDGARGESPVRKQVEESYFLWLSVSVIPWAETLK